MKFYFNIEVGFFDRPSIRQQLENSKAKILHWYPDSRVLITETKGFLNPSSTLKYVISQTLPKII